MKSKVSRKNKRFSKRSKHGSGPEVPDIENQLHNVSTVDNKYMIPYEKEKEDVKKEEGALDEDIDKPKNVVEFIPKQKKTSIEPMDEDIESNIPSDENFDVGDYGVYDTQFYGGIKKTRRNKSKKAMKSKKARKIRKTKRTKRNKKY
jgi:hypothetical protein